MARGFESKAVADQQAEAENRRAARPPVAGDPRGPRRRGLELARADVLHRIEQATDERYRAMLRKAIADLDAQLSALG